MRNARNEGVSPKGLKNLDKMETLKPFVPRIFYDWACERAEIREEQNMDEAPFTAFRTECLASCMLADISGFTALSEKLCKKGKEGLEILENILNGFFDVLIKTIFAHGGDIIKFAGDALIVMWSPTRTFCQEKAHQLTARSLQCALELRSLEHWDEWARLTLHLGIAGGSMWYACLGNDSSRCEFILGGAVLRHMGYAEGDAKAGEVVIHHDSWEFLSNHYPDRFKGRVVGDHNNVRIDEIAEIEGKSHRNKRWVIAPVQIPYKTLRNELTFSTCINIVRQLLPRGISENLLETKNTSWLKEIRRATVLFVNIDIERANETLDVFQNLFCDMFSCIEKYGAMLRQFIIDDKGCVAIVCLGLSGFAHRDDPLRGVQLALRLSRVLQDTHNMQDSSIGITTGNCFCGVVGTEQRREYAVVGDIVNLAARLMAVGKGTVRCDKSTKDESVRNQKTQDAVDVGSNKKIEFRELEPISVKGKSKPVDIFEPSLVTRRFTVLHAAEFSKHNLDIELRNSHIYGRSKLVHAINDGMEEYLAASCSGCTLGSKNATFRLSVAKQINGVGWRGRKSLTLTSLPIPEGVEEDELRKLSASEVAFTSDGKYVSGSLKSLARRGLLPSSARSSGLSGGTAYHENSRFIILEARAGFGKSCVLKFLWRLARSKAKEESTKIIVSFGRALAAEKSTPYFIFKQIFFTLFGMADCRTEEDEREKMHEFLDSFTEDEEYIRTTVFPVLKYVLQLQWNLSERDDILDEEEAIHGANTKEILMHIVEHCIMKNLFHGHIFFIEDLHDIDISSWSLLSQLCTYPVFVIASTRPWGPNALDGIADARKIFESSALCDRYLLNPLDNAAILQCITDKYEGHTWPPNAVAYISEHSGGNPFWVKELAQAMFSKTNKKKSTSTSSSGSGKALFNAKSQTELIRNDLISEELMRCMVERLDDLDWKQQILLKTASSFGNIFPVNALQTVLPRNIRKKMDRTAIVDALNDLENKDFVSIYTPEPYLSYMFQHDLVCQVTYSLCVSSQLRKWHRLIAIWYQSVYHDDLRPHYPILAYHYHRAGDTKLFIKAKRNSLETLLAMKDIPAAISITEDIMKVESKTIEDVDEIIEILEGFISRKGESNILFRVSATTRSSIMADTIETLPSRRTSLVMSADDTFEEQLEVLELILKRVKRRRAEMAKELVKRPVSQVVQLQNRSSSVFEKAGTTGNFAFDDEGEDDQPPTPQIAQKSITSRKAAITKSKESKEKSSGACRIS